MSIDGQTDRWTFVNDFYAETKKLKGDWSTLVTTLRVATLPGRSAATESAITEIAVEATALVAAAPPNCIPTRNVGTTFL